MLSKFRHIALHSSHHVGHAAAGHHFHHFACLVKLLDQPVHVLDVCARAFGYARPAAGVEDFRVRALLWCHAEDDGFNALEGIVVDVNVFDGFSDTWDHGCQVFEVTHFLDLVDLS